MSALALLLMLIAVALLFDFLNGFMDSANVVATIVASNAMSARGALAMAALANLTGPFLFGVAVAQTVGAEVVEPNAVTIAVVFAAVLAASAWNVAAWYFGIPVSSSHALIGGIIGAAVAAAGTAVIRVAGVWKIILSLLISPVLGLVAAIVLMQAARFLLRRATPGVQRYLLRAQLLTGAAVALSHGSNDAQKTMGIIALALMTLGFTQHFVVPWWAIIASATTIAVGTAVGGWRIIRTLGSRFYRIRPLDALVSQTASASVILAASALGGPVSSTHVVSMTILGAGAAERKSKVRWAVLGDMLVAWALTMPATALVAVPLFYAADAGLRYVSR